MLQRLKSILMLMCVDYQAVDAGKEGSLQHRFEQVGFAGANVLNSFQK